MFTAAMRRKSPMVVVPSVSGSLYSLPSAVQSFSKVGGSSPAHSRQYKFEHKLYDAVQPDRLQWDMAARLPESGYTAQQLTCQKQRLLARLSLA